MKRISLSALAVLLLASFAAAGPSAEDIRTAAETALQGAFAQCKPAMKPALFARQAQEAGPAPVAQGQLVTLRLSGHVWLRGNAFVPQGSSFATVNVSGSTTLYDQNGHALSGTITVSDMVSVFLGGSNYVTAWARPYAYVSVYDNGRFLGSTRVDGSVMVSGWANNGWLDLSGNGTVSGTLTYTAE